jgi:hypothetical protein
MTPTQVARVAQTRRMSIEANANGGQPRKWPAQKPPIRYWLRRKAGLVADHEGGVHSLYGFGAHRRCPSCIADLHR